MKFASQSRPAVSNGRSFRYRICPLLAVANHRVGERRSMLKDISIISIPVADLNRARDFYHEVLGFDLMIDLPFDLNKRWIQLAPHKESKVSITLVSWYENMKPGSLQGLVLETDDIYAFFSRLKERGVQISPVYDTPWGKFSDFKDPDGNGWMLHQQ